MKAVFSDRTEIIVESCNLLELALLRSEFSQQFFGKVKIDRFVHPYTLKQIAKKTRCVLKVVPLIHESAFAT